MTLYSTDPRAVYEMLAIRTEYGVRKRDGHDETILNVGDEALMRQHLAEAYEVGEHAEPVVRTVTAWTVDETAAARVRHDLAREQILSTAQRYWECEIGEDAALDELRPHASAMSDHDRAELLGELVSELEHQENVDEDRVAPGLGEDKQTLIEDAERRVNDAADALYGGAS